jgi:hypothetical protein
MRILLAADTNSSQWCTCEFAAETTSYNAAFDAYKHDVGTITAVVANQTQLLQATLASGDVYSSTLTMLTSPRIRQSTISEPTMRLYPALNNASYDRSDWTLSS